MLCCTEANMICYCSDSDKNLSAAEKENILSMSEVDTTLFDANNFETLVFENSDRRHNLPQLSWTFDFKD